MAFTRAAGYNSLPNGNFSPVIYSKQTQLAFRKSSVCEDITNNDYFGEIANFGDTVRIIKEPEITVKQYARGLQVTPQDLDDEDFSLVVDKSNYFAFKVDDIESNMSHVNWRETASSAAAYALRDAFDEGVLATMFSGVSASSPNHILGSDSATDLAAGTFDGTGNLDIGFGTSEHDPIDV